jgi:hypothetical protein
MKLFFLYLALLPLALFGQKPDSVKAGKIAVGIILSPDYCYRILKTTPPTQFVVDSRNSFEVPKIGFTAGLSLTYRLNKRMELESGIQYSDKGEQTNKMPVVFGTGQSTNADPYDVRFNYHYEYLDVPLKFNYYLLLRKFKLYVSAGMVANIFLTQRNVLIFDYPDGHTTTQSSSNRQGLSAVNLSAMAGFGVRYDLGNRLHIRLEPVYRNSIVSIIDAPVKGYLYSAGLIAGIYLRI